MPRIPRQEQDGTVLTRNGLNLDKFTVYTPERASENGWALWDADVSANLQCVGGVRRRRLGVVLIT